jgi:hypothetical protein
MGRHQQSVPSECVSDLTGGDLPITSALRSSRKPADRPQAPRRLSVVEFVGIHIFQFIDIRGRMTTATEPCGSGLRGGRHRGCLGEVGQVGHGMKPAVGHSVRSTPIRGGSSQPLNILCT